LTAAHIGGGHYKGALSQMCCKLLRIMMIKYTTFKFIIFHINKELNMKIKSFFIVLLLGFAATAYSANQKVTHVVMIWLNDGLSEARISNVIDKANVLSSIEVVDELTIGKPVASEKKTVDDSFTFAISMSFENIQALQQYMVDEIHHEYVQSVLKPALKKVVIYDYK